MRLWIIFLLMFIVSCSVKNKELDLVGFNNQDCIIYSTARADFHFGYNDLLKYYSAKNAHDIIKDLNGYISSFPTKPVVIPDTIARVKSDEGGTMRNNNHDFSHIQDDIDWTIIDFAKQGNLKIYSHITDEFLKSVTLETIDDNLAGTTSLKYGDSILTMDLRWIK